MLFYTCKEVAAQFLAEPLACSEYHAVSSVGWCFSRADLMQLPSANIISGRWWCTGVIE